MMIVHDKDFDDALLSDNTDEPYFRILHDFKNIPEKPSSPNYKIRQVDFQTELPLVKNIINASYEDIQVSEEYITEMLELPVFYPEGWIIIEEKETSIPVGLGIADLDTEIKEGMLEWIQVNPGYRGNGIGKTLVIELLNRLKKHADFATVSGQVENETNPKRLYRSCGFTGNDVWHILRLKES
jgi:ribosomal protein S18 acetylase RimI-like enzyme